MHSNVSRAHHFARWPRRPMSQDRTPLYVYLHAPERNLALCPRHALGLAYAREARWAVWWSVSLWVARGCRAALRPDMPRDVSRREPGPKPSVRDAEDRERRARDRGGRARSWGGAARPCASASC